MAGGNSRAPAKWRPVALGVGLVALMASCGGHGVAQPAATMPITRAPTAAAGPPVATTTVAIRNFAFNAPAITVPVGATVTWTNDDIEQHTVTADDKSFDSDTVAHGQTYRFTFSKAGTFRYGCLIHPDMVGNVIVTVR